MKSLSMFSVCLVTGSLLLLPLAAQAAPAVHAERMAAVRAWLDEDIALAEKSGLPGIAASHRADLAGFRSAPPVATAVQPHPDLLPPIGKAAGNPVMKDFLKNLQKKVLAPDKRFPKGPEGGKGLTDEGWAFVVRADELLKLAQAFCHPQSEVAGRPEWVAPLLRRLAFFAEYMAEGGPVMAVAMTQRLFPAPEYAAALQGGLAYIEPHNQRVADLGYRGNLWEASFWNSERVAAPWPDNYLTYDRNVEGPRARYGPWSYVGTTRKTGGDRGKSSYVGCVIETGRPGSWQLDAALQDAGMEIRVNPSKDTDTEHRGRITLAHEESVTTSAVGEPAAALGAVSRLGTYRKPATEWITRQAWLMTPERMVGLVTLEAGEDFTGAGIYGRLYLVSGRATWGVRKELRELGGGGFSYGALTATFHAHDFAGFEHESSDVMGGGVNQSSAQKSCRLMLVDEAAKSGATTRYPKGTSHFYLVELRPFSSAPAKVSRVPDASGVLGFTVKDGSGSDRVAFNPTDQPVTLTLDPSQILHRSGEKLRAAWLKEAGAVESVAAVRAPSAFELPAGEIIFVSERRNKKPSSRRQ